MLKLPYQVPLLSQRGISKSSPPRYKTVLLSWSICCGLSPLVSSALSPLYTYIPLDLKVPINGAAVSIVLNYLALPPATLLCQPWLYAKPKRNRHKTQRNR
jgi:antibiotic biosynthesis monooxygenase (ABM) superfamily enzyme